MNRAIRSLLFFSLAACSAFVAKARIWTIDGKTKVEGEFSGIMGDIVFLSQANGDDLKVHLASLSAEDRAFIKNGERATTSVVSSSAPPPSKGASRHADADFSEPQPIDMAPGGSKPVTFRPVVNNVDPNAPIGNTYYGPPTNDSLPNRFTPMNSDLEQFAIIARDELQKAHYNQLGGENLPFNEDESAKARYELGAQVSRFGLDTYFYPQSGSGLLREHVKGHMVLDWEVYDTFSHKVTYTHTIDTDFKGDLDDSVAPRAMFRKSFRRLLADPDFAAFMKPEAAEKEKADKGSATAKLTSLSAKDQVFIKNGEVVTSSAPPPSSDTSGNANADFSKPQPIDMAPGGSKPVIFQHITFNIEEGDTIGTISWEPIVQPSPNIVREEFVSPEQYAIIVRDELQKAHYNQLGGDNLPFSEAESAKARYELGAKVSSLRLDVHYSANRTAHSSAGKTIGHMTIDWQVYDTLTHKIAYTNTIDINFDKKSTDWNAPFTMFRKSLRQLLADRDFVAFMKPEAAEKDKADKGSATAK